MAVKALKKRSYIDADQIPTEETVTSTPNQLNRANPVSEQNVSINFGNAPATGDNDATITYVSTNEGSSFDV